MSLFVCRECKKPHEDCTCPASIRQATPLEAYNQRREHEAKRKRATRTNRFGRTARADKITGRGCRVCGRREVEYHHIVPRSQMPGSRDITSVDNAMPLCHLHHQAHHTTAEGRIPRRLLSPAEEAFAQRTMGAGWLDRWYPITATLGRTGSGV